MFPFHFQNSFLFSETIRNIYQLEPTYTINNGPSTYYSNCNVIRDRHYHVAPCKFFFSLRGWTSADQVMPLIFLYFLKIVFMNIGLYLKRYKDSCDGSGHPFRSNVGFG